MVPHSYSSLENGAKRRKGVKTSGRPSAAARACPRAARISRARMGVRRTVNWNPDVTFEKCAFSQNVLFSSPLCTSTARQL
jgi:hypothetical protein